jgi:hypothetical protein
MASGANAAPSLLKPRSATNTDPGATCRESCVTPMHTVSSAEVWAGITGRSPDRNAPAHACNSS